MFNVSWESKKFEETYNRSFDNEDYAIRHANDMFSWGYDVCVKDKDGSVGLRLSHKTNKPAVKNSSVKVGDRIKIVACKWGHGFPIGSVVTVKDIDATHPDDITYTCYDVKKQCTWALGSVEFQKVEDL